ncbi:hypothetical protein AMTRI_Chr08g167890 [Amborella trichopoda]|uniref:ACT domain-containing protein n=1 Tax=Amborella trichopoda TaxID=13333 RepID=W1P2L8_AMBTC|nr:transcription factor SCREAM2 [Amborella trichopoda]ERN04107.1 hypothetical protein AMTR_s00077p00030410 [Amborella trichopoda]|eukprot:XP_006842432.1 transcription factor SCREAM2 [Amborella trichopoda]
MDSREQKRVALREKLQVLRSVTNSNAVNKASIIVDASKYIKELKQKVDKLNKNFQADVEPVDQSSLPLHQVTVETLEKGFLITVFSAKSGPGLLVSILEAFEELGLNVLQARVSCTDTFRLEAVGGEDQVENESVDAQAVKQVVLQAINNCSGSSGQE